MNNRAKAFFAIAALLCLAPAANALAPYAQDFEGLVQSDPDALANDGWLVFGNVFGPDWSYWYGYGPFPAPNTGAAFCAIAAGEGGTEQGAQQLVVFSDYNNLNHADGAYIESNVFQEQTIVAADLNTNWDFDFEAKLGNLAGSTTALAFIKTLDPANGYMMTNFITANMTTTSTSWTGYTLSITIDPEPGGADPPDRLLEHRDALRGFGCVLRQHQLLQHDQRGHRGNELECSEVALLVDLACSIRGGPAWPGPRFSGRPGHLMSTTRWLSTKPAPRRRTM